MSAFTAGKPLDREAFDRLVGELRPKLHRYCARMTGSVLDGEDVVHEAIVKAPGCRWERTLTSTASLSGSRSSVI
jgi:DNA-directed RNA polymerase specialized sigma24 family protein